MPTHSPHNANPDAARHGGWQSINKKRAYAWSEKEIRKLKYLRTLKFGARKCAAKLGIKRASVENKLKQLGLYTWRKVCLNNGVHP